MTTTNSNQTALLNMIASGFGSGDKAQIHAIAAAALCLARAEKEQDTAALIKATIADQLGLKDEKGAGNYLTMARKLRACLIKGEYLPAASEYDEEEPVAYCFPSLASLDSMVADDNELVDTINAIALQICQHYGAKQGRESLRILQEAFGSRSPAKSPDYAQRAIKALAKARDNGGFDGKTANLIAEIVQIFTPDELRAMADNVILAREHEEAALAASHESAKALIEQGKKRSPFTAAKVA